MAGVRGKKVLLGITGGVAAYKSAVLTRLLVKSGAEVQVVMTAAAAEFITPTTLQALSGRLVRQSLFDPAHEAAMGHIELARWADLILVAPATADFLARMAAGMADDLLATLCLATSVPIAVAPAMNQGMWSNPATEDNLRRLATRGVLVWGPDSGLQACGEQGPGRLLEPERLHQLVNDFFVGGDLAGVRVVLTAGPTREPIDPVRYLTNRSSGKMGFALAAAFANRGADVVLVTGPVALATPNGVERVDVETAREMDEAVMGALAGCSIFVGCAAVADYRPAVAAGQKIKKLEEHRTLELVRNPDILARVAAQPSPPFTVGFAAETQSVAEYAEQKRRAKGVDIIAANLVAGEEGGFERDQNALTVLWEGGMRELPLADKGQLARELVTLIVNEYGKRYPTEDPR
ncbi:MAG: bifunctional phosphopantothenoylcysteine decarboxylase/phosphopantothenate--cysteine ligase CoaBC [Gammaproteobacteria bacterium]|nr:bifunctional phosphopantothenoylcysteine decarboxylase/phosphopantothenate--cysteine ligase CoaBC [Gammaproteobacteria bacterium]